MLATNSPSADKIRHYCIQPVNRVPASVESRMRRKLGANSVKFFAMQEPRPFEAKPSRMIWV